MSLSAIEITRIVRKTRKYRVKLPDTIVYSDRILDSLQVVQNLISNRNLLDKRFTTIVMEQNGYLQEAKDLNDMSNSQYQSFLETHFSKRSGRLPV